MSARRYHSPDPIAPHAHPCDWKGCPAEGVHRAPKNRGVLGSNSAEDYFWFCETHIREFNQRWDYFAGMSPEDIESFQREAIVGHRPTWPPEFVGRANPHETDLETAINRFYAGLNGRTVKYQAPSQPSRRLTSTQTTALAVMELPQDASGEDIKKRYKTLVKQLHPDVNKGDKKLEDRFKRVVEAYHQLHDLL